MTGAILATLGVATVASGGSGDFPDPMVWTDVFGAGGGSTNVITAHGIVGGPASITMTRTGLATVAYVLNGIFTTYTGAFNLDNGDTLSWSVINIGSLGRSGTVTVKAAGGAVTVGTFDYIITGSGFQP